MNKVYQSCMYKSDYDRIKDELCQLTQNCKFMLSQQKTILGKWEIKGYIDIFEKAESKIEKHYNRVLKGGGCP